MEIGFYTPAEGVKEDLFGCASFGFPGQWDPLQQGLGTAPWKAEKKKRSGALRKFGESMGHHTMMPQSSLDICITK